MYTQRVKGMVTDEYRAYLLRLWRVEDDGGYWRARLENVDTGEQQGFASIEKLIEFLQTLSRYEQGIESSEVDLK
jgi:hypothetical protein